MRPDIVSDYKLVCATAHTQASCTSLECGKKIMPGDPMWIDRMSSNIYDDSCGKSLQYRRDKAASRGEVPPVTFEDAEARWQQAMRKR